MDASIFTATHDTASAGFHMADFSSFLTHLTAAVSAAWPERLPTRYRKVKALLLSWDKDDLGVEAEIAPLETVFRGLYRYDTEYWKIPSKRSAVELSRKVADLVDAHGQEENLLILYYAGHARPSEQPGAGPVWAANRNRDSPTVQTSIIRSLLAEVDCDVLLLHDCWHSATQNAEVPTGKGLIETLSACGTEPSAAEAGRQSFTASLVQELAHAAHTTDWLSVVELHRRLINRLQAWIPTVSFTDDTYSLVQVDPRTGQPMFETPRRPTPTHSFQSLQPRSIVLSPLPLEGSGYPNDSFVALNAPATRPRAVPDGPGVLVTCRLRDPSVEARKWKEWLVNAPERARDIQISAIYPGLSAVLVLELPLVVWDLLPPSPAISFVSYTSGQNHISEFRRALGLDAGGESDGSADEDGEQEGLGAEPDRSKKRGKDPRSKPATDRGSVSPWPEMYESGRTAVYATEDEPHCLNLAEMQQDHSLDKTGKIIRAFVQDTDNPSMGYLCGEIEAFCSTVSFESLANDQEETAPDSVAMLDERYPPSCPNPGTAMAGTEFLTRSQLYQALSRTQSPPLLIDQKPDQLPPRRRLIYVTNLDAASTLALVSTASESQALFLRDFVYKHIAFQPGMEVKLLRSGSQAFQLSFHLPFLAWRQATTNPSLDTRLSSGNQPLRHSQDVSFLHLAAKPGSRHAYVHEAQISVMVAGVDSHHWTAYGFFDTYHDGGASRHDVRRYRPAKGGFAMDPLTAGRQAADAPIWTAREYFLRAMEACVREAREEWLNVGRGVARGLKTFTRNARQVNRGRARRVSRQTVQVLEQLIQGLSGTVAAWESFEQSDLAYFDLDRKDNAAAIKAIVSDMQDLRALAETMKRQADMFKSITSTNHLLATHTATARTTSLLTLLTLAFLPFALTALLSSSMSSPSPPIFHPHSSPFSSSPSPNNHNNDNNNNDDMTNPDDDLALLSPAASLPRASAAAAAAAAAAAGSPATATAAAAAHQLLLAAAWLACLAAVAYLAAAQWSAAAAAEEEEEEAGKGWAGRTGLGSWWLGPGSGRWFGDDGRGKSGGRTRRGRFGLRVLGAGGGGGDGDGGCIWGAGRLWQGGWWGRRVRGGGAGEGEGEGYRYRYGRLGEREDGEESDSDGRAHRLPF